MEYKNSKNGLACGQGVPADQTCFAKIVKYKLLYSIELNQISTKLYIFFLLNKFGMAILLVNSVFLFDPTFKKDVALTVNCAIPMSDLVRKKNRLNKIWNFLLLASESACYNLNAVQHGSH